MLPNLSKNISACNLLLRSSLQPEDIEDELGYRALVVSMHVVEQDFINNPISLYPSAVGIQKCNGIVLVDRLLKPELTDLTLQEQGA